MSDGEAIEVLRREIAAMKVQHAEQIADLHKMIDRLLVARGHASIERLHVNGSARVMVAIAQLIREQITRGSGQTTSEAHAAIEWLAREFGMRVRLTPPPARDGQ